MDIKPLARYHKEGVHYDTYKLRTAYEKSDIHKTFTYFKVPKRISLIFDYIRKRNELYKQYTLGRYGGEVSILLFKSYKSFEKMGKNEIHPFQFFTTKLRNYERVFIPSKVVDLLNLKKGDEIFYILAPPTLNLYLLMHSSPSDRPLTAPEKDKSDKGQPMP